MTDAADRAARIADDAYLKLISRFSMAGVFPLLAFLGWLASSWLEDQEQAMLAVASRVSSIEDTTDELTQRVVILETNQVRGRADREEFQAQMLSELKDLRGTIVLLSNRVAGLDATIQAMRDRADAGSANTAVVVR